MTVPTTGVVPSHDPRPTRTGGSATWACTPGFSPVFIFPFTPPEYYGVANLHEFQTLMYRPLYWYGVDGRPEIDDELSLAEPPQWSADGRTTVVTVRPHRWSNGEAVDADGVLFWMRLLEAHKRRFGGYVPGCFPDNLVDYAKVAPDKVAFTFDRRYSPRWVLMNQLSTITPLPRAWLHAADANGDADALDIDAAYDFLMEANDDRGSWASSPIWSVVNGPWRLAEYRSEDAGGWARLTPNPHYSGPHRPLLDELVLAPMRSDEEQYELLRAGRVQVGYLPFEKAAATTEQTRGAANPLGAGFRLVPQVTYRICYFPMNFRNPGSAGRILGQLYVRQALQSVLDQDHAIREIYRGYGYPTHGPIPLLPDSDLISPAQRRNPYPFDPERARQLLAEHGWDLTRTPGICVAPGEGPGHSGAGIELGDLLRFTLRFAAGHPTLRRLLGKLADDAAEVGIELTLVEVDAARLVLEDTTIGPGEDAAPSWELSCWNGGWGYAPAYHPTGEALFGTGSAMNFGSFSDPVADGLIERTVVGDEPADLFAYQDYIAAQLPVIWMPNFPIRLLEVAKALRGIEPLNPYGLITPERWHYGPTDD